MQSRLPRNTPLVLVIRDGWGTNPNPSHGPFNAVHLARTPVADRLMSQWPNTLIKTSGEDVGLPEGTMGNSEVGHQNIGAGRIVDQEAVRITKACRAGLETNAVIAGAVRGAKQRGRAVHLMGICSDAGVHGLLEHLDALLAICARLGHDRVFVHLFTDGRDTGPYTGAAFVARVEESLRRHGVGRIASVIGRFWAMDRDHRWERVHRAWACLTGRNAAAQGVRTARSAAEAVRAAYDGPEAPKQLGDEFVPPTMVGESPETLCGSRITADDAVIFYNYRGDRPRELVSAFVLPEDEWRAVKPSPDTGVRGFARGPRLDTDFVMMTAYSEALARHAKVAFPKPPRMVNVAGEYLASLGMPQFRCAETEKYPHVTFFFNDYRDEPFPGERREIIQSPTDVKTYDQRPEMSAFGVRDAVLRRLAAIDCEPFIVVNFANGDMVGHTGNLGAAVRACEVVDECVGAIVEAALARGGSLIVTADHGNAEQMWDPDADSPHTAHTTYDVPLIVAGESFRSRVLRGDADPAGWFDEAARAKRGRLADVVPTVLDMMGLAQPPEMTGRSLLV
ncbi:MAG: 2,3-bisphosphoglycerate-independent phosphoglycerate mutase [Leptolyngbya sp. PLA2]|nr:2,3-bisphosphoglycerate-independent phosphoglycerate mutase [Leptolyngbya sp. PL-A2]MCQ3941064.1 2,3-bisphosphoglycerate-independent phosphoglycerate mutase [cyanobacterium CYA1]MCZ7633072.1 2,3-bisphosphoglycerate-independent phosphoglycerate mutase [Phycisphaerales bacterium]MDL1905657.1 2,3-bisphosphoglycerate-independent phosphoglycerate mutase [Synechococcales cyanobacterium CNB]GIK18868.1 MAG: 2,3-bisphosphoglycerate-independent phosphoglycerate mutase [Planctomycetota bacterium]